MELNFTQAEENDLEKVLFLFKFGAENVRSRGLKQWEHWLEPTPELIGKVQIWVAEGRFFFVEKAKTTVGMFRLMETDEEYWGKTDDSARYVHSLLTLPEFAGQGIGEQVLAKIAAQLSAQNVPFLRLDCMADNAVLCSYYERQGFQKVRLQKMPHYTVQLFEKKSSS